MAFLAIAFLSLTIWIFLLLFWGQFWRADRKLERQEKKLESYPSVYAIIPARNEADLLPTALRSLLTQDYPGIFSIVLIDDRSTDGTAKVTREIAEQLEQTEKLTVISGEPLPTGWTGKLWAIEQGIRYASQQTPDYFLLTDADIEHGNKNLCRLVAKAERDNLDLVSLMVLLRCQNFWEKLLIPAFVFFFQKLYPFPWVNNPYKKTAAAAGGCILLRRQALERIGGIGVVRQALIDDCALARAIKSSEYKDNQSNPIWLGLTESTRSLRPYDSLQTIWDMVTRTAYSQLNYSPWLLMGTVLAMSLVYLAAPLSLLAGIIMANGLLTSIGLLTWLLMSLAYLPTVRLYQMSPLWAVCLPAIAFLYTLMTIDSALKYWQGKGGAWKGRVYSQ
ncbi:glycosyltransferase [Pleurocapsales cyanobacterium LEGE 06147]|nr:glycosyltransferase [Pleurocapsales cyanobacterium LEGE 06147]